MGKWDGQAVAILASGPSLTVEDCEAVKAWGGKSIVINTTYQSAPWADVLYGCSRWWQYHLDDVKRTFRGELWTEGAAQAQSFGLNHIESRNGDGLSTDPAYVHRGGGRENHPQWVSGNSGYQAVNLAYHWGATRMILLGFDMQKDGRRKNHHKPHPNEVGSPYAGWVRHFSPMASDLAAHGVEVLNATPNSALDCFTKVSLREALDARTVLAA